LKTYQALFEPQADGSIKEFIYPYDPNYLHVSAQPFGSACTALRFRTLQFFQAPINTAIPVGYLGSKDNIPDHRDKMAGADKRCPFIFTACLGNKPTGRMMAVTDVKGSVINRIIIKRGDLVVLTGAGNVLFGHSIPELNDKWRAKISANGDKDEEPGVRISITGKLQCLITYTCCVNPGRCMASFRKWDSQAALDKFREQVYEWKKMEQVSKMVRMQDRKDLLKLKEKRQERRLNRRADMMTNDDTDSDGLSVFCFGIGLIDCYNV